MLSLQSRTLYVWTRYLCALLALSEVVVWGRDMCYIEVNKLQSNSLDSACACLLRLLGRALLLL